MSKPSILILTSILLMISCGLRPPSNEYKETVYLCGSDLLDSRYLPVLDSEGKRLSGASLRILSRTQNDQISEEVKASSKGCIPVDIMQSAKMIHIGTTKKSGDFEGIVLTPASLIKMQEIQLQPTPPVLPEANCHKRYLQQKYIDPMSYVSFENVPASLALFYSLNASLRRPEQGSKALTEAFSDPQPSFQNRTWDISSVDAGSYVMDLAVFDHIQNKPVPNLSCPIDTINHHLDVDIAAPITRFSTYFDRRFGVVDEGYVPNFYIREGLNRLNVRYCIKSVLPEDPELPLQCDEDEILIWKEGAAKALPTGFHRFIFQASIEDLKSEWEVRDLLVNKVCSGNFTSSKEIIEQSCNEIVGSIFLRTSKDEKITLKNVSRISGTLNVSNEAPNNSDPTREKLSLPNLVSLGSLRLEGIKSKNIASFPSLVEVRGSFELDDVSLNSENEHETFPILKTIAGTISLTKTISPRDPLPQLKSSANLKVDGRYLVGFNQLERVYGDLELSLGHGRPYTMNAFLKLEEVHGSFIFSESAIDLEFNAFQKLKKVVDNIVFFDNYAMESLPKFEKLASIGGSLEIEQNESLLSIEGFDALQSIGKDIKINGNPNLASIKGFDNLSIARSLAIVESNELSILDAYRNLHTLSGPSGLSLGFLPKLRDISVLSSLQFVGPSQTNLASISYSLIVKDTGLTSLNGLENVKTIHVGFIIEDNPSLKDVMGLRSAESLKPPPLSPFFDISPRPNHGLGGNDIDPNLCPIDAKMPLLAKACKELQIVTGPEPSEPPEPQE